jgi:hypothetical protein
MIRRVDAKGARVPRSAYDPRALAAILASLLLLSGCGVPVVEPSASVSSLAPPSEPTAELSHAPTPSVVSLPTWSAADVTVTVEDLSLTYPVEVCPILAWLDPAAPDSVEFGTYPDRVVANDGSAWATHMTVLETTDGVPVEWSFILTTPLSVEPLSEERRLVAGGLRFDDDDSAEVTGRRATFMTGFGDSELPVLGPDLLRGTVTVECR